MMWGIVTRRAALALVIGAGAAISAGSVAAQTKWNLPAAYPANNYHSENLVWFAEEIKKATGGKLEITVHAGASLFKAPEIKRAVATGQAQLGEVLISIHENEDPVFGLDTIPFLTGSLADARETLGGPTARHEQEARRPGPNPALCRRVAGARPLCRRRTSTPSTT